MYTLYVLLKFPNVFWSPCTLEKQNTTLRILPHDLIKSTQTAKVSRHNQFQKKKYDAISMPSFTQCSFSGFASCQNKAMNEI